MDTVAKRQPARKATLLGMYGNAFLFVIKMVIAIKSGSLIILAEAMDSFTDIVASIAVYISVRVSAKKADEGHPFGHHRAEPISGLIVAVIAGMAGMELIHMSITRLISGEAVSFGIAPLLVLLVTIGTKAAMKQYLENAGRKANSPALLASAKDCKNDVLVAFGALMGMTGAYYGYYLLDPILGMVVSLWIIRTGYSIGVENIDYLMGKKASEELIKELKEKALGIEGVKGLNEVKTHYVGNYIHVEMHINVDGETSTTESHRIGKEVQRALESLESVDKAFVHIDPWLPRN
ncbi:MAG: cation diffusion facilitator family transporter [Candidatus Brocadiaceae bacterium]|nr:cation diffusion facilitator family transporter [Candidatus Brocadiaceae bacterium]